MTVATSSEAGTLVNTVRNTEGLAPPWQPGQSGNPNGRPLRPSLRSMMLRREVKAWETFDTLLTEGSEETRKQMFLLFVCLGFRPTQALATAAKRIIEGDYTEAELVALEEQAKLLAKNEEK